MTSQILFDRLAYVDRLKAASFTEQQARGAADALGEALTETVATKADIAQLDSKFAQVETRIAESRATIIQWVVGVAIAACTVGAAVAGLIIKHVP
jgi:hypothetical protein